MDSKQYIFVLNNKGEGAIVPFPASFDLPEKKFVKDKWFFKTDRIRTENGFECTIYTEKNCTIDIEQFADAFKEPPKPKMSDTERVERLRSILEQQIAYYIANKDTDEGSYLYDTMYEQFNDLPKSDYIAIIEALLEE